jgi:tetratricopeptide (TPR) repeat protein
MEEVGQFDKALEAYRRLKDSFPDAVGAVKLDFRFAYCYENLEQWRPAFAHLNAALQFPKISPAEKIQAEGRIAIATYHLGDLENAKRLLRAAIETYQDLRSRKITVDNYYFAKTCFTLGDVYFGQFQAVKLEGDQSQLEQSLESKATLFILARAQYLKAIKTYDQTWMFASLFRIGQGYELFYFAMLEAPVPPDVEGEQKARYTELLKERLEPVIQKALEAYRQNLKLGANLKVENPWIEQTRQHYEKLSAWIQEHPK